MTGTGLRHVVMNRMRDCRPVVTPSKKQVLLETHIKLAGDGINRIAHATLVSKNPICPDSIMTVWTTLLNVKDRG